MPTHPKERKEALLVFYDSVYERNREPEDLIWWMIENEMGEPTPDDWIALGALVARDQVPVSDDFKAIVTEHALRAYGDTEEASQVIFENLEGHPYSWWGSVFPGMVTWSSSDRDKDIQSVMGHLLDGKMVSVVSAPDWIPGVDEWEVVSEASVDADATEKEADEYLKLFNTNLSDTIDQAGLIEDPADYPEEGQLPDGWDSALLRLSDDWADWWFDTELEDFVGQKAPHLFIETDGS